MALSTGTFSLFMNHSSDLATSCPSPVSDPSQGLMESENMRVLIKTSIIGRPSFMKRFSTTHSAPFVPRSTSFAA